MTNTQYTTLGGVCLFVFVAVFVGFALSAGNEPVTFGELSIAGRVMGIAGVVGGFLFWFLMLAHFSF